MGVLTDRLRTATESLTGRFYIAIVGDKYRQPLLDEVTMYADMARYTKDGKLPHNPTLHFGDKSFVVLPSACETDFLLFEVVDSIKIDVTQ